MKIGILTGGGDCPGLNPAIRGVAMRAFDYNHELIGIRQGWAGLVRNISAPLTLDDIDGIIDKGGTILESSRTNPFKQEEDVQRCLDNFKVMGLDALVALGGEDTLGVAAKLFKLGVPTVGVPKTMDNDVAETDYTFGFDSAVAVAVDSADRLKDTARSHRRIMVLEVMGRHAGWVALWTGVAAGADWIFIPEVPMNLDEMAEVLKKKVARGKTWGLVVASEGTELPREEGEKEELDAFGHMILKKRGVAEYLSKEIEERVGVETRSAVLGHIIRGGVPTPFDRLLASRLGIQAMDLVLAGKFGYMSCLKGNEITAVPLEAAMSKLKTVPIELYEQLKHLFDK